MSLTLSFVSSVLLDLLGFFFPLGNYLICYLFVADIIYSVLSTIGVLGSLQSIFICLNCQSLQVHQAF